MTGSVFDLPSRADVPDTAPIIAIRNGVLGGLILWAIIGWFAWQFFGRG